ncbi:MAG: hypothetical protein ACRDNG_07145, partial [Gaiellaceae bacterium]
RLPGPRARLAAACAVAVLAATLIAGTVGRSADLPGASRDASSFDRRLDDLFALVDRAGRDRFTACGAVSVTDLVVETALAWKLDRELDGVELRRTSLPPRGTAVIGPDAGGSVRRQAASASDRLAWSGPWTAYSVSCDSGRRIAGVSGARR